MSSSPCLTFRPATSADTPAAVKLINSAYRGESAKKGWTAETDLLGGQRIDNDMFQDLITPPNKHILLFFLPTAFTSTTSTDPQQNNTSSNSETPIALIQIEYLPSDQALYLGLVTVNPELQAQGYGKFVLQTAENWAQQQHAGAKKAVMTVFTVRTELIAWYVRRGYVDTGKKEPFMYGQEQFGLPKRDDLEFVKLEKVF